MTQEEIDEYIGKKIRLRRWEAGLTLKVLAAQCGVTFQQIHKYETGANRVSVPLLIIIAQTLRTTVDDFLPEPYRCQAYQSPLPEHEHRVLVAFQAAPPRRQQAFLQFLQSA